MNKVILFVSMSFLISGTCIGAGILGLPLQTGQAGFTPSILGLIISWALMFCTGFIMLDRILCRQDDITDMAAVYEEDLGRWAKYLNTIGYMITFYGVIVAYLCGATTCIIAIIPALNNIPYAEKITVVVIFILATSVIVFWKDLVVKFNAALTLLLIIVFIILLVMIVPRAQAENLNHINWSQFVFQFPILATSFAYQLVLPYIAKQSLKNNFKKSAMIGILLTGTLFVLVINTLWVISVLGVLPLESPDGISIIGAFKKGQPATVPISIMINSEVMTTLAIFFSLFAIGTSYFGVGIGFMSYIKDLTTGRFKRNKFTDFAIAFLLPFLVALIYPDIFIRMLGVVGGFGVILVFGILPGAMAWKACSRKWVKVLGLISLILSLAVFGIQFYIMFLQ